MSKLGIDCYWTRKVVEDKKGYWTGIRAHKTQKKEPVTKNMDGRSRKGHW